MMSSLLPKQLHPLQVPQPTALTLVSLMLHAGTPMRLAAADTSKMWMAQRSGSYTGLCRALLTYDCRQGTARML